MRGFIVTTCLQRDARHLKARILQDDVGDQPTLCGFGMSQTTVCDTC